MALAVKRGQLSRSKVSKEVTKIADKMSEKDIKKLAKTKHDDLPVKVQEHVDNLLSEIPMGDLKKIDAFADKKLSPNDVVLTGKHFFDRLNDKRNKKEISNAELIGFFKRLSRKKKEFLEFLKKYKQVVATDNRTNINIPFMVQANRIIAKTIMRKKGFTTTNKTIQV